MSIMGIGNIDTKKTLLSSRDLALLLYMAAFVRYVSSFSDLSLQINLVFLHYSLFLPTQIYSEILL